MKKFVVKGEAELKCLVEEDKVRGGYFNIEDVKNAVMSKPEMYNALSGKTVKCIYVNNEGIGLFAVQDLQNNKVYILDHINTK